MFFPYRLSSRLPQICLRLSMDIIELFLLYLIEEVRLIQRVEKPFLSYNINFVVTNHFISAPILSLQFRYKFTIKTRCNFTYNFWREFIRFFDQRLHFYVTHQVIYYCPLQNVLNSAFNPSFSIFSFTFSWQDLLDTLFLDIVLFVTATRSLFALYFLKYLVNLSRYNFYE